jgi:hypothetical protein
MAVRRLIKQRVIEKEPLPADYSLGSLVNK